MLFKQNTINLHLLLEFAIKSLIEENKKDINEAIRNLSFERFIIRKNGIRHQYTTLAVSENSRYYKQLKDTNKIKNYKQLQEEYTPSNLIDEKDKIRIFSYTKNSEDESWKYYYEAENYLLKNPHTYKMIRNGDYIYYNELCNGIRIKVLTFKVDSIHGEFKQQVQIYSILFKKHSLGVENSSFFLGLLLISCIYRVIC